MKNIDYETIIEILKIVEDSEYGVLNLETDDLKLNVRKKGEADHFDTLDNSRNSFNILPSDQYDSEASKKTKVKKTNEDKDFIETESEENIDRDDLYVVRSPMLGTFYRSPGPGDDPYAEIDDTVNSGDTLCLIEVMKLFNSISAELSGRVVEFLVDDGEVVEYNQPIVVLEPVEL